MEKYKRFNRLVIKKCIKKIGCNNTAFLYVINFYISSFKSPGLIRFFDFINVETAQLVNKAVNTPINIVIEGVISIPIFVSFEITFPHSTAKIVAIKALTGPQSSN